MILTLLIAIGTITAAVILIDLYLTVYRFKRRIRDNDKWFNNKYKRNKSKDEERK